MTHLEEPKTIEKKFLRSLKKKVDKNVLTGEGKVNRIEKVTSDRYYLSTEKSMNSVVIHRKQVRKAISYFSYRRTITRKQLEIYSNFSSALLGLLRAIFERISIVQKTVSGLLRLSMKGTRVFFSGVPRSVTDLRSVWRQDGKYLLLSYYHLRDDIYGNWIKNIKEFEIKGILFDSGAYSLHEKKRQANENGEICEIQEITLDEYAAFIMKHKDQDYFFGYISLDVINDKEATRQNQLFLEELTGIAPYPVWHPDSGFEELQQIETMKQYL